jgi:hypothetical protein
LEAPISSAVTVPVVVPSSSVTGRSAPFLNAKSAAMNANWSIEIRAEPAIWSSRLLNPRSTDGAGSGPAGSGPVWIVSLPPGSLVKSITGSSTSGFVLSGFLPLLRLTWSEPASSKPGIPTSSAVPPPVSAM